jgi:3-keto-disaccharide hydrolase
MTSARFARRILIVASSVCALSGLALAQERVPGQVPDPKKEPPIVTPGTSPGAPPSDAIVLFDGKDLSQWASQKDPASPAPWAVGDGVITVKPGSGAIQTRRGFGSCQLHIEFATPAEVKGDGQGRGNSGVFLMGVYELQVLDSYQNKTYFHGQAGAIYKQHAPLVNASRKPGEWQTYDVVFHAPTFDADGKLIQRATFTVLHNGVLIQDHVIVMGVTSHDKPPYYEAHPDHMPLALQDHNNPTRFRNIWIRELGE